MQERKEIMSNAVVSFCIATFQKYNVLKELIDEILSVDTDKIEVVVCDDQSLDDSVEKIKQIADCRLKIHVNEKNAGSSLNICKSLDQGSGKWLFYVNDRDNVDRFKIKKLIQILEQFEDEDVAFAKCIAGQKGLDRYCIFETGKEALVEFACSMEHPTGYIFRRDIWQSIKCRKTFFENQKYGDYPITQICAIIARKHNGALIYGDICDLNRQRIDFNKVKSGYYNKRNDKRLWYTPEVIFRELKIGQKFLKQAGIQADIRNQILIERYREYLAWCVTGYEKIIANPVCTAHYNVYPPQDFFHVFITSILNGIKLWSRISTLCMSCDKQVFAEINKATRKEYLNYFKYVCQNKLYIRAKLVRECRKRDIDIYKKEELLKAYEKWVEALLEEKSISEYLSENGYSHVALYGMGRIGRHLSHEFSASNIHVDYVVDQVISKQTHYYDGVSCYSMENDLPYTDLIIVTVPSEAENIIKELRKKVCWQIKSIDDILFVL